MDNNKFCLTDEAQKDMQDIWLHIAQDSVPSAEKFANELEEAFFRLSRHHSLGSRRPELLDMPVRFWVIHNYYIIYNPETDPLQILRIISSFRDIKNTFKLSQPQNSQHV